MSTLRDEILSYARERFGTEPDYPWDSEPTYAVLRHKKSKKWYGLIMDIPREKLGLSGGRTDILNQVRPRPDRLADTRRRLFQGISHVKRTLAHRHS